MATHGIHSSPSASLRTLKKSVGSGLYNPHAGKFEIGKPGRPAPRPVPEAPTSNIPTEPSINTVIPGSSLAHPEAGRTINHLGDTHDDIVRRDPFDERLQEVDPRPSSLDEEVVRESLWMDSAFAQTLLPSMQWEALQRLIDNYTLRYLSDFNSDPSTRQAFLSALGDEFVRRYYEDDTNPRLLYPPFMTDPQREVLLDETRPQLVSAVRNLCIREQVKIDVAYFRYQAMVKGIFHNLLLGASGGGDSPRPIEISEMAGSGLARLCTSLPELFPKLRQLAGHVLPRSLSRYIWWRHLWREHAVHVLINKIRTELTNRGLKIGDHMSTTTLLNRITTEIPDTMVATEIEGGRELFNQRLVRVLSLYFLTFSAYAIDTVIISLPLLVAFPHRTDEELVCIIRSLCTVHLPVHPQETTILAEALLMDLEEFDPELAKHLAEGAHTHLATRAAGDVFGTTKSHALSEGWGSTPAEVISRWIARAFVGILSPQAVRYVWDQCFFLGFATLSDFAIILLIILRDFILQSHNSTILYDTLTRLPMHIFTLQITHAFVAFTRESQNKSSASSIGTKLRYLPRQQTALDSPETAANLTQAHGVLADIFHTGFTFQDARDEVMTGETPRTARDEKDVRTEKERMQALLAATKVARRLKKLSRRRMAEKEEAELTATSKYTGESVSTGQRNSYRRLQSEEEQVVTAAAFLVDTLQNDRGREQGTRRVMMKPEGADISDLLAQGGSTAGAVIYPYNGASQGRSSSSSTRYDPLPDLDTLKPAGPSGVTELPSGKLPMYPVKTATLVATAVEKLREINAKGLEGKKKKKKRRAQVSGEQSNPG